MSRKVALRGEQFIERERQVGGRVPPLGRREPEPRATPRRRS